MESSERIARSCRHPRGARDLAADLPRSSVVATRIRSRRRSVAIPGVLRVDTAQGSSAGSLALTPADHGRVLAHLIRATRGDWQGRLSPGPARD